MCGQPLGVSRSGPVAVLPESLHGSHVNPSLGRLPQARALDLCPATWDNCHPHPSTTFAFLL